jgi:anti-sigma factor RsiW
MLPKDKNSVDDRMLTQYLLGALPEDDAERLDELSVTDDAVAARLDEVENHLVDAHVRGELPAEYEAAFRSFYLATPHRRAKVAFAGELAKAADAAVISPELTRTLAGRATTTGDSSRRGIFGWLTQPHLGLQWGFAAAALMLALVASYLLFVNRALMSRVMQVESLQLALDSKQREVLAELKAQSTPPVTVPPHAANSAPAIVNVVASVLLLPQTRGVAQPAAVLIDKGAATVPVELALEPSDGFKRFDVALKDPATGKRVWSSGALALKHSANLSTVVVGLPAKLLRQQNYSIELNGITEKGAPDLAGTYAFHAVIR